MMRKPQFRLTGICLFLVLITTAQEVKFGKVSKEELMESVYAKDSSAPAVVLYRDVDVSYSYAQSVGFQVITRVHERTKLFNKNGFKFATVTERLYKSKSDRESLSGLKAFTYTLENGEVVKTKLKSSEMFSKSLSKYHNEEKFTMPNVKEGSVVEYEYKIVSPFAYSIDEIVLQYDIPIQQQHINISIPEYFAFKPSMKGYLGINPKYGSKSGKINFQTKRKDQDDYTGKSYYSSSSVDYTIKTTNFTMRDVPALQKEPHVNNMNNYRSSINYELQYVKYPNSPMESFTTTWEKVVKTIYNSDSFGKQLTYSRFFKNQLNAVLAGASSDVEKMVAVFSHVQRHMNWNGYFGKYAEKGVKDAYEERTGNVADINLILVSMLREAGLTANPVLISTRDNGVPLFPTREGFNYVIASAQIADKTILLDACNKYTEPNLLPTSALNWSGRIIKENGSSSIVSVVPGKRSVTTEMMSVNLDVNGDISGKIRKSLTYYNAYLFRNTYNDVSEEDYLERLENTGAGMEISNYKVDNSKVLGKPIVESFDFYSENQLDIIGDKIYFSPLLFNTTKENPFKLEERNYPIDFTYPRQKKYILNITIPEGYTVTSKPEDLRLALENNMGSFIFRILNPDTNTLQIMADFKINQAVIPVQAYGSIKELYKKIVEKETEKVVLSKI